jgi:alpha-mannosidase
MEIERSERSQPAPGTSATREVIHLVPHTHWDREWYLPWQRFRMRLVDLVDGLLDEMARDDRVRFTLDGQTATVDDYLEVRPEREPELRRLVGDGRLAVGPWRILMDEFLVSGETLVRNLEMGVARASELGCVMRVGYLPDMFGHVAQMPQILRRAGIEDAVVWRGVPASIDRHQFTWSSPDGSAVRCEYLLGGYGNGRDILALADRIDRKLDVFVGLQRAAFGEDELLAMYGEDHSIPRPGYADLVTAFNESQDRYEIRIETLGEAIAAIRRTALPPTGSWTGELRSSARANVLMGVISHRVEVKQAAGRVERLIERAVEPLWALHGEGWPAALLGQAWRRAVENSAHDSICACSAEPTVAQVLVRFGEAEQIGRGLLDKLVAHLASRVPRSGWLVLNPTPTIRSDVAPVEVPLALDATAEDRPPVLVDAGGRPVATQDEGFVRRIVRETTLEAAEVLPYLRRRMHARELFTYQVNGYRVRRPDAADGAFELTIDTDLAPDPDELDVDELLDRLARETAAAPGSTWDVAVVARPRRRLLARVTAPALGVATIATAATTARGRDRPALPHPVVATDRTLSNGLVAVRVAPDGTLVIEGGGVRLSGVGRIVDGGDAGDSYNYAPPATDRVVEQPTSVAVEPGRPGPLVAELLVRRAYDWPAGLLPDLSARTDESVATEVAMRVEVRADEPFVRLAIELDNRSVDHRVRLHVPLPGGASTSRAEGQFAIVERGLEMEGGHGEVPLPTFPAHSLVAAGPVAALVEHVVEYELTAVDGSGSSRRAGELALTLVRATGLISRDAHPYRDEPAGPVIEAPTGQAQGRREIRLAILPLAPDTPNAAILAAAETFRNPLVVGAGTAPAEPAGLLREGSSEGLSLDGDAVVLSALRRVPDADVEVLELRVVHEDDGDATARIAGPFTRAREVDLLGSALGEWIHADGVLDLRLGPWEIRTLRLEPSALSG